MTVEMTEGEEWLCINRWDLDNVKHDKTVMVGGGGGSQVLDLTLKSQMSLSLKTMRFGVVNDPMLLYHTPYNGKYVLVST